MNAPLLVQEPPLQVLRGLAKEIGLNEAIVLQQVHYRQQRGEGVRDGWLRRTYREWHNDFPFWSSRTIERIFNSLRNQDLLLIEDGDGTDRALRYRINYSVVPSRQIDEMQSDTLTRQSGVMSMKREKKSSSNEEDPALAAQISEVYEHWRSVMGKNGNAKLTPERQTKIKARLKDGYSPERLKRAIDGCGASDFHRSRGFDDLTLICRNGSKLEEFEAKPITGAELTPHQQEVEAALARGPEISDAEVAEQLAKIEAA